MTRHRNSQVSSYGGDAQIVATRTEIDRVIAELNALEVWLRGQIELQDFVIEPVLRTRLALELPPILQKLDHIRLACESASDGYFGAEFDIARELRQEPKIPIAALASGVEQVASSLGLLGETKVSANLVGVVGEVPAPTSLGSLAERLDNTGNKDEPGWLRIEKFIEPASPVDAATGLMTVPEARYVVYVPGTQSWGPATGINPFDLTSNLSAISKTGFAGSERAVEAAMKQAGINPDSKVLLVGHSQGGIIAANISTRYAGSKVLTLGAPIGQLAGQLTAPTLSVEHKRDPVPRLDARPNPLVANWVTAIEDIDGNDPISQHELLGYQRTANRIDAAAAEPGLAKLRAEISGFAGGSKPGLQGQAFYFELKREP